MWCPCVVQQLLRAPEPIQTRKGIGHVERNLLTADYNRFTVYGKGKKRKGKKRLSMTENESFLRRMIIP